MYFFLTRTFCQIIHFELVRLNPVVRIILLTDACDDAIYFAFRESV